MSGAVADMAALLPWLPALAPVWPLVLLVSLALPPWRWAVLRLAPWAPLLALLLAIAAPPAVLPLPGLLLGGSLQLDTAGRWLLAAVALLWLTGGWLASGWLCRPRRAAAWLLAMAGALWLPLTGDLPSALAASVLAAYPLYGLLGGGRGGRVLLASVVIADLLVLEAALMLAKGGAGLDFDALRAALPGAKGRDVVLALLLIGFGTKAGLMGLHYWLAPAMEYPPSRQLGPTVAFTLAAGLLPLLRLLPLGETPWPSAGAVLPWLALAGGTWAVAAGLLQASRRTCTAYALSALVSLWVGLLGLGLAASPFAAAMTVMLPPAMALSAVGVAALLLAGDIQGRHGRLSAWGLVLLSALLPILAVLGAALPMAAGGGAVRWSLMGLLACGGVLLGASATLPAGTAERTAHAPEQRAAAVLVAGGLCMVVLATLSASVMPAVAARWSGNGVILTITTLFGGFAVGLAAVAALARLPRIPAGDLLTLIEYAAAGLVTAWHRLGAIAGQWRDRFQTVAGQMRRHLAEQRAIDNAEARLHRWSTATLLVLVVGTAVALLAQPG
jgi:formate hydrogenlyase subunit 3/multisubunit Na+/H+ antiporter MnhD subunit